jgi:hypothetical protein
MEERETKAVVRTRMAGRLSLGAENLQGAMV